MNLPWSQGFYLSCQDVGVQFCLMTILVLTGSPQIRSFVQNFYQFIEGVSQHHRNIDDLLSKVSVAQISRSSQPPLTSGSLVLGHHTCRLHQLGCGEARPEYK